MNPEGTKQTPPTKEQILKFYKEQIEVGKLRRELATINADIADCEARRIESIARAAHFTSPGKSQSPPQDEMLPPGVVEHIVTQEDLDNNPELVAEGIKVGDRIGITQTPTLATEKAGIHVSGEPAPISAKKERGLKKV